MYGPVVTGAELIRIIDEHGGMRWCIDGYVQFLRPPGDTSLLQIGTRLIGINASLYKAPRHCTVASPLFSQRGGLAVILEPDAFAQQLRTAWAEALLQRLPSGLCAHYLPDAHE